MARSLFLLAPLFVALPGAAIAESIEDPNYTTHNLLIYNERDQILLQRNFMGWSTPGTRYDKRLTIDENIADLANNYGVQVCNLGLVGQFSYRYGYTPAISTRSHYAARLAGGTAKPPKGFEELRWVDRETALRLIADGSQKAPPALVDLTRQMLRAPNRIWSGAFSIWRDGDLYRSRMIEPFRALGTTARIDRKCPAS